MKIRFIEGATRVLSTFTTLAFIRVPGLMYFMRG